MAKKIIYDLSDILELLPHREPFLLSIISSIQA